MKKTLLFFSALILSVSAWCADQDIETIYAWVKGQSTCYQLSSMPKVTYQDNTAVLTLAGQSQPSLTVSLEDGGKLMITIASSISAIEETYDNQPVQQVDKMIRCGRLIIVKDGVQYDAMGNRL